MKLGNKISEKRLEPKHAVPSEILEQYPWHWDPMKKDHDDASCYMHKIKDFDWKALGDWAIKKCNEHLTPQKYWWYDDENDAVMHANDNVNSMPIKEQALLALKNNTHNKHNSQYFKIANDHRAFF